MAHRRTPRRGPTRRLAAGMMLVTAILLVVLSGVWYTTARRPYLTVHPLSVPVAGARAVDAPAVLLTQHGVLSAARTLDGTGAHSGYLIIAEKNGYKSPIRVECTFSVDGKTLAGIRILSQDETEYLGTRITAESFTAPFAGRLLPIKLWQTAAPGSPVDGLTGSTVSAQAVVDAVNNAYTFLQQLPAA